MLRARHRLAASVMTLQPSITGLVRSDPSGLVINELQYMSARPPISRPGAGHKAGQQTPTDASVVARFGLKLTVFLIDCVFQMVMFRHRPCRIVRVLCLALALWKGERPFGRSLTYWNEAARLGLVVCQG
jgi:hypothetical protein